MEERKVKKREVRDRLNVTRYGYAKLIKDGILDAPIGSGHGFHTESQVQRAQQRLFQLSLPKRAQQKPGERFRPISEKMRTRLRASAARQG